MEHPVEKLIQIRWKDASLPERYNKKRLAIEGSASIFFILTLNNRSLSMSVKNSVAFFNEHNKTLVRISTHRLAACLLSVFSRSGFSLTYLLIMFKLKCVFRNHCLEFLH